MATFDEIVKLIEEDRYNISVIDHKFEEAIKDALVGSIDYGKYVAFFGSCFSNFYRTNFYLEDTYWSSVEKYFMWKKAVTFEDMETADIIFNTDDAKIIKKLGRQVKNFSADVWNKIKEEIMFNAVSEKFKQDAVCYEIMLRYANKEFVEGNPYDVIWGVGINYNDPQIADEKNWRGQNLLGKILNRVKEEIINYIPTDVIYVEDVDIKEKDC